jgi:prepilin-type processing-associated H-X9-DG protein
MFKTDKQLGNRSVMSDTFSRYYGGTGIPTVPGMGWWAHKDGYNVLYGDGHAQFYGDPKQTMMWWYPLSGYGASTWQSCNNDFAAQADTPTYYASWPVFGNGPELEWHLFDEAGGVDIGVDYASYHE